MKTHRRRGRRCTAAPRTLDQSSEGVGLAVSSPGSHFQAECRGSEPDRQQ